MYEAIKPADIIIEYGVPGVVKWGPSHLNTPPVQTIEEAFRVAYGYADAKGLPRAHYRVRQGQTLLTMPPTNGTFSTKTRRTIYLIGSLRNAKVLETASRLRQAGHEVFDDWYSAGEKADDEWQAYSKQRGWTYAEALAGYSAQHVFNFDKKHILRCDTGVLVLPAGKSGHLELGVMLGIGLAAEMMGNSALKKEGYILLDGEPERYDVMYNFANKVFTSTDEAVTHLGG